MDEALRAQLLERAAADQAARERLMEDPATETVEAIRQVDEANTAWLERVVRERGWPGRSLVGEDGAQAAWYLVQHADHQPAFQRTCLDLMDDAVARGEASAAEWAYLTDRVLLAEGRPQRYGTQFTMGPDGLEPQPMEAPDRVDERRASAGLGALAEYRDLMLQAYGDQPIGGVPLRAGRTLGTCRNGPLQVRISAVEPTAGAEGRRPQPEPVEPSVPLPWLPEGCSPCRTGPAMGATRDGIVVVAWFEAHGAVGAPVEVHWPVSDRDIPRFEPVSAGTRPAVRVSGTGSEPGSVVVVMTEGHRRFMVSGTLPSAELLRVAATLPE